MIRSDKRGEEACESKLRKPPRCSCQKNGGDSKVCCESNTTPFFSPPGSPLSLGETGEAMYRCDIALLRFLHNKVGKPEFWKEQSLVAEASKDPFDIHS